MLETHLCLRCISGCRGTPLILLNSDQRVLALRHPMAEMVGHDFDFGFDTFAKVLPQPMSQENGSALHVDWVTVV
jgi:hypothetical protein